MDDIYSQTFRQALDEYEERGENQLTDCIEALRISVKYLQTRGIPEFVILAAIEEIQNELSRFHIPLD